MNSHLVVGNGVNLSLLGAINGFGPGSNIDLSAAGFASYTYSDNAGTGTGGTLTLLDGNGNATGSVALSTGEFTAGSFYVHAGRQRRNADRFRDLCLEHLRDPVECRSHRRRQRRPTARPHGARHHRGRHALADAERRRPSATYDAVHSTSTNLVFNYTVQAGQNTADLTITGVNLNGASATDVLGHAVSLAGAVGNPAGTLQIDTTAPHHHRLSPPPPAAAPSRSAKWSTISLTPSEAVTVAGGTPTLTLNDGGIATYDAVQAPRPRTSSSTIRSSPARIPPT